MIDVDDILTKKNTVFLHVGMEKTGTTAIQKFLENNQQELFSAGYYVPSYRSKNGLISTERYQHLLGYALRKDFPEHKRQMLEKHFPKLLNSGTEFLLNDFKDRVLQEDKKYTLISTETLSHGQPPETLKALLPNHSFKIIIYLRRQDYYLESFYNMAVRTTLESREAIEWYQETRHKHSYLRLLESYAEVFGYKNIIVRNYENLAAHQNSLVDDFLSTIRFPKKQKDSLVSRGEKRSNSSIDNDLVPYFLLVNRCLQFIGDKKLPQQKRSAFSVYLKQKFAKSSVSLNSSYQIFLPKERALILSNYAEENRKIEANFLSKGEILFRDQSILENTPSPTAHYQQFTTRVLKGMATTIEKTKLDANRTHNNLQNKRLVSYVLSLHEEAFNSMGYLKKQAMIYKATKYFKKYDCFDTEYYKSHYDIKGDPIRHYLLKGVFEGYNPSRKFSTVEFLSSNITCSRTGINPLLFHLTNDLVKDPVEPIP